MRSKAPSGNRDCFEVLTVDLAGCRRVRRTWIGSSTPRCTSASSMPVSAQQTWGRRRPTNADRSDGRTPDDQVQQILDIAAILPGQRTGSRFFASSQRQSVAQAQTRSQPPPQRPQQQGDLIDIGREYDGSSRQAPLQAQQQQAFAQPSQFQQAPTQPAQNQYQQFYTPPPQPQQVQPFLRPTQPQQQTHTPQQRVYAPLPASSPGYAQPAQFKPASQHHESHPQGSNVLTRQDSRTHEVDEFVDAET